MTEYSSGAGGDGAAAMASFERAAEHMRIPAVGKTLSNEQKLMLYAAFKQGNVGDCNDPRCDMAAACDVLVSVYRAAVTLPLWCVCSCIDLYLNS